MASLRLVPLIPATLIKSQDIAALRRDEKEREAKKKAAKDQPPPP